MNELEKRIAALTPEQRDALMRQMKQKSARPAAAGIPVLPRPGSFFVTSFAQQRLWFLDQLEPGSPLYNIAAVVQLDGALDASALERSFAALVERHESFRTTFSASDGKPVQIISQPSPLQVPVTALDHLPEPARAAEAARLCADEAQRPFNLTTGPLLRASLLRLGPERHLLLLTMHHIVSDGWSMGVLVREFAALYSASCSGQPPALPRLPIQYADFAAWQRGFLQGDTLERQLSWWREQLDGAPASLELPTDRPRPAQPTYRGASLPVSLSRELSDAVRAVARKHGATPFMVLLAGFQALLHRCSGQQDVCVGSPIANRNRAETEGLIGFFVNTLVLRARFSPEASFLELLSRVRETTLGAYNHQDIPFERLVEELQPSRTLGRSPLFQACFALQNAPMPALTLPNLSLRLLDAVNTVAKFELTLALFEQDGAYSGYLEYNTDLFDAATAERMARHLRTLLAGALEAPERRVDELPLMTPEERRRVLVDFNATEVPYPRDASISQLFEEQARRAPDAIAVEYDGQTLTYAQLDARANPLAHHLRALGVGPDVPVGVCLPRSLDLVVTLLGILKAGGAYVPLDPSYPEERLAFMVREARLKLLVTLSSLAKAPAHGEQVVCLDTLGATLAAPPAGAPASGASADNLAYVMFTSGSTGRPKGVSIPHRGIVRLVKGSRFISFSPDQVFLLHSPSSFDASTLELWGALLNGARVAVLPPHAHTLEELGRAIQRHGVTTLWLTAALFEQMISTQPEALASVRQLLAGGDVLPRAAVLRRLEAGGALVNGYGPTESTTFTCCYPMTAASQVGASVSIGTPIANTQVFILDADLQPTPIGVPGELYISGDGLARGYLHRPELTAERFLPNPFGPPGSRAYRTGDLARYLPDGRIEFLGRADAQVKIRGFRIELAEIEAALALHPDVRECAVVARDDGASGKRLVAYFVPRAQPHASARDLRAFLAQRLPEHMLPSAFVALEALPLSPNGKVDRKALPAPDAAPDADAPYAAPTAPTEELLASLWASVLAVPRVGIHDNFFELGGHSLMATQLISRVRETFSVELPLRAFFEAPTVAALARRVDTASRAGLDAAAPLVAVARTGSLPLSFAQQRLWFLEQLEPGQTAYNMPLSVYLDGPLDPAVLERSFHALFLRHESLRTTFRDDPAGPVQVIAPEPPSRILELVDLQALPEAERDARTKQLAQENARAPFDLVRGPLLRATLVTLAPERHALLVTMHHIISDGWSIGLLVREVAALYDASTAGRSAPLPALPVQYADYAAWQRSLLQGEVLDRQLAFWRQQLDGAPELLELPTDRPRPAVQTFRGAHLGVSLPDALSQEIRALAQREGATPFMVLLAAFQTFLHRYSGQDDVCVGTPIANRHRIETEGLIGFFVNTLVLRSQFPADTSFRALLARVRETSLGAYAHQDLPFEKLVEALQPTRSLRHSPLFQAMFSLQNTPAASFSLESGLSLRLFPLEYATAQFDLTLALEESARGFGGHLEYNTDLFDADTAARMVRHFVTLLEGLVARPEQSVDAQRLLTPEDERHLLVDLNATARPWPLDGLLHTAFEAQVARTPDALAVSDGATQLSFRQLNARANQLAHHLRGLGIGPDVPVAFCLERSADSIVAILGILKAGGAYVPLDPAYPAERLAFMLRDSGAPVLVSRGALSEKLADAPARLVRLDADADAERLAAASPENPPSNGDPAHLAYVIYTSGSTGTPKGVMVPHRSVLNLRHGLNEALYGHDAAPMRVALNAPLAFDASVQQWVQLLGGHSLFIVPEDVRRDASELLSWLTPHEIEVLDCTPTLLRVLVDHGLFDLPAAPRWVLPGGEAIDEALWAALRRSRRTRFANVYGPTECTVDVTALVVDRAGDRPALGQPMGNVEAYVLDRHLQPVPAGVAGELFLGGAQVSRGYLGRPDLTAERFLPNPFRREPGARLYKTGDLARRLADGTLEYLGRLDHQIKLRGFRIELGEIEAALSQHPSVREAVVMARDLSQGKALVAYVTPRGAPPAVDELRAALQRQLPAYMVPSAFVVLDALPLLPNGKVNRKALPAPSSERPDLAQSFVAPRTPTEELLAGIWAQVLHVEKVGVRDDFFSLGGHSLLATQVLSRLRSAFQIDLPLRDLFAFPTVEALASRIDAAARAGQGVSRIPLERLPRTGALPLSFAQQRLWFLDQLEPNSPLYNIPAALRLEGTLDVAALEKSLAEVLRRHEALRTTFHAEAGQPVQVIAPALSLPLEVVDLGHLAPEAREEEARKRALQEALTPFDLARGPLVRFSLLRLSAQSHLLLLTLHHTVSDGWSMDILRREVAVLYGAFSSGKPSSLPELSLQYADYAAWQRQWLQGEALDAQLAYWRKQLAGVQPLELPTDRPRPAVKTYRGASKSFHVPGHLRPALREVAQRENATDFMVMLAAFQAFLHRYTGQDDLSVGSPIAGRNHEALEPLIGFFVNTLVLRTQVAPSLSFRELVARVREVALGAYAHQDVPFEKLVEELQPERDLSRSPLFQALFMLQRMPSTRHELPGLSLDLMEVDPGLAKFDLLLQLQETADGWTGTWEYNTDLFDEATLVRLGDHFARLLEGALARPEQRLSALPLLGEAERQKMLMAWNDTRAEYPRQVCMHELFEAQVARTPDAVAAVFEGQTLTYRELDARANRLARQLQAAGIGPEVRAAVFLERSLELLVGLMGVLKAGGAYVPVDPDYPTERVALLMKSARAKVIVTQRSLEGRLPADAPKALWVEDALQGAEGATPPRSGVGPDNLAYIIYTSGSTGVPKGVAVRHRPVANLIHWVNTTYGVGPADHVLFITSPCFDLSVYDVFGVLAAGGVVHVASKEDVKDPQRLSKKLREEGITYWDSAPPALQHLVPHFGEGSPTLRLVFLSGDWIPLTLPGEVRAKFPNAKVIGLGGATEATIWSNFYPVEKLDPSWVSVPYGRPIQNARYYVLDKALEPCPVGVAGDLYIGGECLADGYAGEPALTAERFIADPYAGVAGAKMYWTGDRARFFADGNIEFLGRADQQVKVRGFRIELEEIEGALIQHEGVRAAAVAAKGAARKEKTLVGYVVPSGARAPTVGELRRWLLQRLPEYMVPSVFMTLESLPLTGNGKLDRKALPDVSGERLELEQPFVAPRTPTEELVASVWASVLGVERVGIHNQFFELGGHSLLATQVVSRLRETFQLEIPLRALFSFPTVASLASRVEVLTHAGQGVARPPLQALPRTGELPLSFAQQRLWFLAQLEPENPFYNIPTALQLEGELDVPLLEKCFAEVLRRHESLRTLFEVSGGNPVQVIQPAQGLALRQVDLRALPAEQREAEARRRVDEEARRPFDLTRDLPFRALLLRLDERLHVLMLTMHHIASDGWSTAILIREMMALYEAFSQGQPSPLPELTVQYVDYARWQRSWLQGEALEEQLSYWRRQLEGAPQLLELPTDRPRPTVRSYRGATHEARMPRELSEKVKALGQQEGATLFMTLMAAFQSLLGRYSGQEDVLVGTDIANRNHAGTEELIGFFINQLVMRANLSGNPSFQALLKQVRETAFAAYAHQDLPYEELVRELNPERSLAHAPIFQVKLILQNVPTSALEIPGLTVRALDADPGTTKLDLHVTAADTADGLLFVWRYSTDLFDASTISRMAERFQRLLEGIVDAPERPLSAVSLLSEHERRELLVDWNATGLDSPPACVHHLFEAQAARQPDAIAVSYEDSQLTYGELNRKANQLAHHLRGLGVRAETRVGLFVDRSLDAIVGMLGILKAGGAYVPLDPALSQASERLAYMLRDAACSLVVTQEALADELPSSGQFILCLDSDWDQIAVQPDSNPKTEVSPENLVYIIYTSGSTGMPKGVAIEHQQLSNYLDGVSRRLELPEGARFASISTLAADLGNTAIFPSFCRGGALHLISRERSTDAEALASLLARHPVDCLKIVPSHLRALLSSDNARALLPRQRLVLGGEASDWALIQQFHALAPDCLVFNHYGPTETTVGVFTHRVPLDAGAAHLSATVPIGAPLPNLQGYLLDAHLQPVPRGVFGELYIGGAGVGRGYLRRPDLTAERFVPDPFSTRPGGRLYRTGDRARLLPDGSVEFLGRVDFQLKLRGFRIELGEIEVALKQHPSVETAVVIAREDTPGDKRLVAYVVPPASQEIDVAELKGFLKTKLPDYMIPSAFVPLAALPLTPNGKMDRKALPAPDSALPKAERFLAPRTAVEEVLAGIWAQVLNVERVGLKDNFFELGGHSLLATQVFSRIRSAFQVDVPLGELFDAPTLEGLSARIEKAIQAGLGLPIPPLEALPHAGDRPLSFAQQRLWFLAQLEPNNPFYNVPTAIRLDGELDVAVLERCFAEVLRRHESLRTTFRGTDSGPVQVIQSAQALPLERVELSALPAEQREAEARRRVDEAVCRPFDLSRDIPVRALLLRLAEHDHVLLVVMHHIASDGWSSGVLVREVASLYDAFSQGQPSPLPELRVQYSDYAVWQRTWLQGEALEQQLAYWRKQLDGAPQVLELPTDRPRPAVRSYQGSLHHTRIPKELAEQVKALGRQEGATLFMMLMTAFQSLLSRYTGQQDILVGTDIANRNHAGTEELIGFFINQLVMRADLSADPTFQQLLAQVRQAALGAYAHQDLPFEELVRELNPERSMAHAPLFQVKLVLQNMPFSALEIPKLTLRPFGADPGTTKLDLHLMAIDTGDGLALTWRYSTDLFEASTISRMAEHFQRLLEGIVCAPSAKLADLPLLSEQERRELLVGWNDTRADLPVSCIHQLFEAQAARQPDAVAVASGDAQLTYGELNRKANQLAHHLRRLGVRAETRVGLFVERSVDAIVGMLGILKAGGAYVPLDPAFSQVSDRLAFMLQDSSASLVVTQDSLADVLPASSGQFLVCLDSDWDQIAVQPDSNPTSEVSPENLVYIIYTSGSTGMPKGVSIEHRQLSNYLQGVSRRLDIPAGARLASISTLAADLGNTSIFPALCLGGSLHLLSREQATDAEALNAQLTRHPVDLLKIVPSHLRALLASPNPQAILPRQRLVLGGEASDWALVEQVHKLAPGCNVFNHYGPTETTVGVLTHRVTRDGDPADRFSTLPIGKPIPNATAYVLDSRMHPVPRGVPGELFIGGLAVGRGYLRRPDLTAERFLPDPFSATPGGRLYRTGDRVRMLPNGAIEFLGRVDFQLKLRGFRIELGEIEASLKQHPAIDTAVVIAREDTPGNPRLVGYLVPHDSQPPDAAELRSFLKTKLPDYMVPSAFVSLPALPITPNGKLDRKALPPPDDLRQAVDTYVAPRNAIEATMAEIWAEVLNLERVSVQDDFFDLGGHSLLATQIISRLRAAFDVELPVGDLFEAPTIAALSQRVMAAANITAEELEQMASQLDQLSDSEVQRLLAAEQPESGSGESHE